MSKNGSATLLARRPYGRTGIQLSIVGFGGMAVRGVAPEDATRLVREAVAQGCNYFDVAPTYGNAEELLGPALQPIRRDVFLACKTTQRLRGPGEEELRGSLGRLRTDHVDLYQLHALNDIAKDVDPAFSKDGVMGLLLEARKEGRIRHIGFSAHTEEAALSAMERFDFDSVLFPINFVAWHRGGFGQRVVERAGAKGVALLAMKTLARQPWQADDPRKGEYPNCWYEPISDPHETRLAMGFTLGLPVTAAVSPGSAALLKTMLDASCQGVPPLSDAETKELIALADGLRPIFHAPTGA